MPISKATGFFPGFKKIELFLIKWSGRLRGLRRTWRCYSFNQGLEALRFPEGLLK